MVWLSVLIREGSAALPAGTFVGGFGARLFEAVSQYGFGVLGGPTIGKHVFQSRLVGVQPHEKLSNIRPRFEAMSFRAGQDREREKGSGLNGT